MSTRFLVTTHRYATRALWRALMLVLVTSACGCSSYQGFSPNAIEIISMLRYRAEVARWGGESEALAIARERVRSPGEDVSNPEGPVIDLVSPSDPGALRADTRFTLELRWRAQQGAKIDTDTLVITHLVGEERTDLTNKIRECRIFCSINSKGLKARGLELPAGRHLVELKIADDQVRQTVVEYEITVT